jgi:hypothetical protein
MLGNDKNGVKFNGVLFPTFAIEWETVKLLHKYQYFNIDKWRLLQKLFLNNQLIK